MSSAKGTLVRLLGGLWLREAQIVAAATPSPGFRRLWLRSNFLASAPGDKIQILLPSDDVRTYTPIPSAEGTSVLGWCHAGGPGARWISEAKVGERVRFLGVQHSLALAAGAVILVGDETSVAVAASYEVARPGSVRAVFEALSPSDLRVAAESLGVRPAHVGPRGDVSGVVSAVLRAQEEMPGATIGLTGGSALVVAVRSALREKANLTIKTKTYWVPGKAGLD